MRSNSPLRSTGLIQIVEYHTVYTLSNLCTETYYQVLNTTTAYHKQAQTTYVVNKKFHYNCKESTYAGKPKRWKTSGFNAVL